MNTDNWQQPSRLWDGVCCCIRLQLATTTGSSQHKPTASFQQANI